MYLYLVRHGQSEGNILRTFHGQTDYPLTEKGREQARQAAEKLRGVTFTRCCASDLSRAWETARICLEGRELEAEACPALREQDVGEMEGLSWEEMEARYPDILHPFIEDWFHTVPPGGESPEEMEARVRAWVEDTLRRGEDTLAVGHNGSLTFVLLCLGVLRREDALSEGFFFTQGTYTAVRVENGKAELLCFNR